MGFLLSSAGNVRSHLNNRPPAEDSVAVVKDGGLARGYGALGMVKKNEHPAILRRIQRRLGLLLAVSRLNGRPDWLR